MNNLIRCLLAFSLFVAVIPSAASAQGEACEIKCPKRATNEISLRRALIIEILKAFDPAVTNKKVRLRPKVLSVAPQSYIIPSSTAIEGITIVDNGFPPGISFGIEGTSAFLVNNLCEYQYRFTILTSGIDPVTGQKLSAKSESFVTLFAPIGRGKLDCTPETGDDDDDDENSGS